MPKAKKTKRGKGGGPTETKKNATKRRKATAKAGTRLLTDDQVREVRKRIKAGETQRRIGEDMGVHRSVIARIASNRSYASVRWSTHSLPRRGSESVPYAPGAAGAGHI